MDFVNSFVLDIYDMFERNMIHLNKEDKLVMVEERAMNLLCSSYRMDSDEILMFLQMTVKFMEKLDDRNDK